MVTNPRVSIIVPCRNEIDHIEKTIKSILVQQSPIGGFEVIVADGASDDGTRNILMKLAKDDTRLRIVNNHGQIVSTGLNAAIRESRGSIIIRMDAHTEYAPDYVRRCVEVLQTTGADNVGGPARTKAMNYAQAAISAAYHSRFSVGGARFHNVNYEGPVDTVTYGCWHRRVFDRVGFFDEELVRNQDDEFNLRLKRAGGKIWQSPLIRSWYSPRASLIRLFKQYMQYGYWKVRVIQKHKIPAAIRHLIPSSFVLMLTVLPILSFHWRPALSTWIALIGLYAISNVAASFVTASRWGWKLFPILPLVFAAYHFGYGYGFLLGILDFILLRHRPGNSYTKLTRNSESLVYPKK